MQSTVGMGAQASLGMTQDRQEKAEEIEKSMIARFSTEYLAEYRAQLTAELNSEVEATDGLLAGSVSQLKSRPVSATQAPPPPLYSGWLTKLGAVSILVVFSRVLNEKKGEFTPDFCVLVQSAEDKPNT